MASRCHWLVPPTLHYLCITCLICLIFLYSGPWKQDLTAKVKFHKWPLSKHFTCTFVFNIPVQPTQVFIHQTFIGYLYCAWCWWYKYELITPSPQTHTHTHTNSTVSSFKEAIVPYFISKHIIKGCKMLLWNSETMILNSKYLK